MKNKYYCPACGTRDLTKLFITNHNDKSLSLHLSSHAMIRKSSGDAICEKCKHFWRLSDAQRLHIISINQSDQLPCEASYTWSDFNRLFCKKDLS
jgi:Zn finger protein HypA/HybF involved in hydrogenase expression